MNNSHEKVVSVEAEPGETRQTRKHAVALLLLKALNDHLERNPESRLDLPPVLNEQGEGMSPINMDIFYAPLSLQPEGHQEVALIYAR